MAASRYAVYLLYWYKSTKSDAAGEQGVTPADGGLVRREKSTDTHWRSKGGMAPFNADVC